MQNTATLSTSVLKKAIDRYYKQLQDYKGRADYELAVRTAFLNLLNDFSLLFRPTHSEDNIYHPC